MTAAEGRRNLPLTTFTGPTRNDVTQRVDEGGSALSDFASGRRRFLGQTGLAGLADKGLPLDVSDVWASMGDYPAAPRELSADGAGKQISVPANNHRWGFFYRESNFAKWGVQEPRTRAEFLTRCETPKGRGVPPIASA
jgi:hypothetical protein